MPLGPESALSRAYNHSIAGKTHRDNDGVKCQVPRTNLVRGSTGRMSKPTRKESSPEDFQPGSQSPTSPYRRQTIESSVRGILRPVQILKPQWETWLNALKAVRQLHQSFKDNSERYRIEWVDLAPTLGDAKLVDQETGQDKRSSILNLHQMLCDIYKMQSDTANVKSSHGSVIGTTYSRC